MFSLKLPNPERKPPGGLGLQGFQDFGAPATSILGLGFRLNATLYPNTPRVLGLGLRV